jgi:hypothetical protein
VGDHDRARLDDEALAEFFDRHQNVGDIGRTLGDGVVWRRGGAKERADKVNA